MGAIIGGIVLILGIALFALYYVAIGAMLLLLFSSLWIIHITGSDLLGIIWFGFWAYIFIRLLSKKEKTNGG